MLDCISLAQPWSKKRAEEPRTSKAEIRATSSQLFGRAGLVADKKSALAEEAKGDVSEIERELSGQLTNLLFSASKEKCLLGREAER